MKDDVGSETITFLMVVAADDNSMRMVVEVMVEVEVLFCKIRSLYMCSNVMKFKYIKQRR